jgi:hypothetical protein
MCLAAGILGGVTFSDVPGTTCFALRTCGAELIEPLPDFSSSHARRSAGCVVRKKNGVAHVRGPLSLHRDETGCVGPDATGGAISQGRGS